MTWTIKTSRKDNACGSEAYWQFFVSTWGLIWWLLFGKKDHYVSIIKN